MSAARKAVAQRRRKPLSGDSTDWQDWRTYESQTFAQAAIVIDMHLAKLWEYRIKPDPFALLPSQA